MKTPLPALALLLFLAAPASAQSLCVRGLVEKAPAISICVNNATHHFRCANLRLVSSAVNLVQYEGQVVEVCGPVTSLSNCRTMNVQTVTTPVDQLVISGTTGGRIPRGNVATFDLGVTPATFWVLLFSPARGWLDLGAPGVLLLDARFFVFSSGLLGGTGKATFPSQVPNDAALANVNLYFQPVFLVRPSFLPVMANVDCFQIQ
jgi:hypothetical protein